MRKILIAAMLMGLAASPALASGLFPGLPNSTSPGTPSAGGQTTGGTTIPAAGCIPMDTGAAQGINPATMCVSPSQMTGYVESTARTTLVYQALPIGSVAYGSMGTNTTLVAGTIYYLQLNLPVGITPSKIGCLVGGTGGTDKWIYGLYNSTGALVENTALAGTTVSSSTNAFQEIALVTPTALIPGTYFIALQSNGTTATARTVATATFLTNIAGSQTGTFGTLAAIATLSTSVVADKGPYCYIY